MRHSLQSKPTFQKGAGGSGKYVFLVTSFRCVFFLLRLLTLYAIQWITDTNPPIIFP